MLGRVSISDAMWRIHSKNGVGVRIFTILAKLRETISNSTSQLGLKYRSKPVRYKTKLNLGKEARKIEADLKESYTVSKVVDMFYMKRDSFRYETEWRVTIYSSSESRKICKSGLAIPVDPHFLINDILLDFHFPEELIEAFRFYFERKLKF